MGAGFTLVEVLIAMILVMVSLLLGLSLLWQQPRVVKRIEAHREALQTLEAALELLRSGALPLTSGQVDWSDALPAGLGDEDRWIVLDVQPTSVPNLYHVSLEARYRIRMAGATDQFGRRSLETRLWRPPSP